MSSFHTDTNKGRVAKMVETVGHLQKSARSNKAGSEEITELCQPLLDALTELGCTFGVPAPVTVDPARVDFSEDVQPRASVSPAHAWGVKAPMWANVRQMMEEAPLKDLGPALLVYHDRVDRMLNGEEDV